MTKEERIKEVKGATARLVDIKDGYVYYETIISGIQNYIVSYKVPLDIKTNYEKYKQVDDIVQWIE